MGKVACVCGKVLSDVCWPDPYIGHLITSYSKDQNREYDDMEVIECDQCGSLLIEDRKNPPMMIIFQPLDKKYHELLFDEFK